MSVEYVVELFDSSSASSWGPNTKLAELWGALNVGWSRYDRLAAKAFFTLRQTDPAIALLTELTTHARITRVATSGTTEVYNGVVTDADSTGDDVVVECYDYISFLAHSIGGYKTMYPNRALGEIAQFEWALAKAGSSPLAFVTSGTFQNPAISGVTLTTNAMFGTMRQLRLQLMYDLSEMGRANTSNHVTYEITRTGSPFYFHFWSNKGSALNMALVLNGRVSDYQYLGGWKSYRNKLYSMGTMIGGGVTDVSASDSAGIAAKGLREDVWEIPTLVGVRAATEYDQQQQAVQRRLKVATQQMPAIAVSIATGTLEPFSGWDLCDTIPLEIVNGRENITGSWRIIGVRGMFDELGEQLNLILSPVIV